MTIDSKGSDFNRYIDMVQITQSTDVIDDHLIVGLIGDFDLSAVARVRSAFHEVVRDGWANIIVDLGEVSFVDSAALGILVGLQRRCQEAGGKCVLVGPIDSVERLVTTSGLKTVLPIADSVEHAATLAATSSARTAR